MSKHPLGIGFHTLYLSLDLVTLLACSRNYFRGNTAASLTDIGAESRVRWHTPTKQQILSKPVSLAVVSIARPACVMSLHWRNPHDSRVASACVLCAIPFDASDQWNWMIVTHGQVTRINHLPSEGMAPSISTRLSDQPQSVQADET